MWFSDTKRSANSLGISGWLFASGFVGLLSAWNLVREGLFGDGLCYAAIARNMAAGKGTFWSPFYSTSFWLTHNHDMLAFYEHPPLMFGIESWFFRLLGDTIWTEKVFAALLIVLTIGVIVQLWKQMLPVDHPLRSYGWLPIVVWYSFFLVRWGMTQNFLDTTMSLFCLIAVWFVLRGMNELRLTRSWLFGGIAVVALIAAFLSKGPVSLHVLAIPVLYSLISLRPFSYKKMLSWTVGITAGFILVLGIILLYQPARTNLSTYLSQQLLAALANKRENTGRFALLPELASSVRAAVGFVIGCYLLRRWSKTALNVSDPQSRTAWFWMVVSLSVILPMMVSQKQYSHYLLPAFPYIALGLGSWLGLNLRPLLMRFAYWYRYQWVLGLAGAFLWLATSWYVWQRAGTLSFDYSFHEDVHQIGQQVPHQEPLGVFPDVMHNFPLHPYLERYYQIAMTSINNLPTYALLDKTSPNQVVHRQSDSLLAQGYQPLKTSMHEFILYRRQR